MKKIYIFLLSFMLLFGTITNAFAARKGSSHRSSQQAINPARPKSIRVRSYTRASKKNEFGFGMDISGMSMFTLDRTGTIYGHSFDEGDSPFMFIAPKLEYCYYFAEDPKNKVKSGVGLGINKFFYGDFNPFNVYVILKTTLPVSDETKISFVCGLGYGIGTTREGDENKLISIKMGIEFDYDHYSLDLSFTKSGILPHHGALHDVIMLGWGLRFVV